MERALAGALSVHNRHLLLELRGRLDQGDPCFEWRVRAKPLSA
jgi:hypothetical protein